MALWDNQIRTERSLTVRLPVLAGCVNSTHVNPFMNGRFINVGETAKILGVNPQRRKQ